MNRRLTSLVLVVLAGAAASCAGLKSPSDSPGTGGASSITPIPLRHCTNDAQCPGGSACVANQCVVKQTNIGDLAIEIDPPSDSGSEITEKPSIGTVTPVLEVDAAFALTIKFENAASGNSQSTMVPASGAVILTVPSRIPGRPALSFQASLLPDRSATVSMPEALRGGQAALTLVPLNPSDQMSPPYRTTIVVPATGNALPSITLPANPLLLTGQLRDALGDPKTGYTARVFQQGLLVSSNGSTGTSANSPGTFAISLAAGAAANLALELVPGNSFDPWVTFKDPLSLTQTTTDLGTISLPGYLVVNSFRLPVLGNDPIRTPVAEASVRAYTKLDGSDGDPRISTNYLRDATTDAMGGATLQLIPGDTRNPRSYTISVVPAPASPWASQCFSNVVVAWNGQPQTAALPDVALALRPKIRGIVTAATGGPAANVIVKATLLRQTVTPPCLPSPTTTSVTTMADGSYDLPLDPGLYQLDYIPAQGSAIPRLTVEEVEVRSELQQSVTMPPPALIEADLRDSMNEMLPNTTVRFFETRCPPPGSCKAPLLRAEAQSDANGHFRAIVAAPPGTY